MAVELGDKFADAALVAQLLPLLLLGALVLHDDGETGVQKRLLTHALEEHAIVIDRVVKHLGIGMEAHLRAVFVGLADDLHLLRDMAAGEFHLEDIADAVQTAGNLVAPAAELSARVQHRVDDLERWLARLLLNVHGDAAAVIGHTDALAVFDGDLDMRAEARERLVDGVIHDLVYKVMQTARARRADVHAWAHTHRFQTFKDLDLTGVIGIGIDWCIFRHGCSSMSLIKGYILRALQKRRGVELRKIDPGLSVLPADDERFREIVRHVHDLARLLRGAESFPRDMRGAGVIEIAHGDDAVGPHDRFRA